MWCDGRPVVPVKLGYSDQLLPHGMTVGQKFCLHTPSLSNSLNETYREKNKKGEQVKEHSYGVNIEKT